MNKDIIVQVMKEKKMSIYKLSKIAGVGYATVYDLVNGKIENPKIETLIKITNVLDIEISQVIL